MNRALRQLSLRSIGFMHFGAALIAPLTSPIAGHFHLPVGNVIGADGATALAEALERNSTLIFLDLHGGLSPFRIGVDSGLNASPAQKTSISETKARGHSPRR